MPTSKPRARCRKCSRRLLIENMYGYQWSRIISYYCTSCLTESVHKDLVGHGQKTYYHYRLVSRPAVVDSWVDIESVHQPGKGTPGPKR
jgi:hypothetical protein